MSDQDDVARYYHRHGLTPQLATSRSLAQAAQWVEVGERVRAAADILVPLTMGPITVVRAEPGSDS